ncbi:ATP-dependent helicase HrpB [Sphingosinicella sp. CPCC 101087]|uniref:ATP-dependent helicase HrpB n=1 Tax=Sphingosinicella sp. CPCC 101087 TaxID=2497754 RepID=UPI00101C4720|nr:ATP-dependent helicase HrpB [Sphingosinicella sp. CPCC 101087]
MSADPTLPIDSVLPDLLDTLRGRSNAVLVAPPGAGKTTAVAPALLGEPWCGGEILLLSPRRLAARAAAERMAETAGEKVGGRIGYATRLDTRRSAATRILVLTEGIFLKRIQADPELAGVSAVLFDEVHERSLDSDFALALALDAQAALRPDLRLLAMSATLDGARFSALLGDAPVIESRGRSYDVDIVHLGRSAERRIEEEVAAACRRAIGEAEGNLLAFLPGVAEIERVAERLEPLPRGIDLHRLHGSLDPAAQRAAVAASTPGRRKLVLATSIAETSLTLDGVRIVVDSGLARRPRYDRAAGLTRLVTERASQAAVVQRAGRAGRQAPGRVYRLWEEAATQSLPRFDPPEIIEADLSPLLLDCAIWGVADPRQLRWLDPPPAAAVEEAGKRLRALGAIGEDGRPTPHGRLVAALPLPPRLAHMLIEADARGWGDTAAEAAVLVSERGLGGNDPDLEVRLRRWHADRGARAQAARGLARRWLGLFPSARGGRGPLGACLALAFPDRVSKRRGVQAAAGAGGADWISVGGRGFRLDPASSLAREEWLAVAEVSGSASGARILAAAPIALSDVESLFAGRIRAAAEVTFDPATGAARASHGRRLGAIQLSGGRDSRAEPAAIESALLAGVREHGLGLLPWSEAATGLRERTAYARRFDPAVADLSDEALADGLDDWLPPLLAGARALRDVDPQALTGALEGRLGWDGRKAVDRLAPAWFESPAGSRHPIDYAAEAGPTVTVRVQALFGLDRHPTIAGGRVPLVLALTSPAGRPVQTTRDLPGFWRGSWSAVAREMRGRYPKHPWPDDPTSADPTLRTKKATARR